MIQEYLVNNVEEVACYIDEFIGVESDITLDDDNDGSVTVFDINLHEHNMIRQFIDDNNYWY